METFKQFIATKAFIVHKGKVLILRESNNYKDGTNSAKYDLPGGRLTPGEHFKDALMREVKEETGLTIRVGRPISVGEWRPTVRGEAWQIVGTFFLCSTVEDTITLSDDHDEYQWILPEEYEKYSIIDNLRSVFIDYLNLTRLIP